MFTFFSLRVYVFLTEKSKLPIGRCPTVAPPCWTGTDRAPTRRSPSWFLWLYRAPGWRSRRPSCAPPSRKGGKGPTFPAVSRQGILPFPRAIQGMRGHPRRHAWNRLRRRAPGGQEIGLGSRNLRPRAQVQEALPTGRAVSAVSRERLGEWDGPMAV